MGRSQLTVVEVCAGAGGQSLGLETAGFRHAVAVDNDVDACMTLKRNRPKWDVEERDVHDFEGNPYEGVDLFAAGVPCPPFSIAGKQLGGDDDRDLFPQALRLIKEIKPRAVLLENVRGFATKRFEAYRNRVIEDLRKHYWVDWRLQYASWFGVPQLRPRFVLVGLPKDLGEYFEWPVPTEETATVGDAIGDLIAARGWPGADAWKKRAQGLAPTIVGGSKKHGGPDLGPTRAREAWKALGVDGLGLADEPPAPDFPITGHPRLTVRMVARLQGFPDEWLFAGGKTTAHRQVGNAFPPPVASEIGLSIRRALSRAP